MKIGLLSDSWLASTFVWLGGSLVYVAQYSTVFLASLSLAEI